MVFLSPENSRWDCWLSIIRFFLFIISFNFYNFSGKGFCLADFIFCVLGRGNGFEGYVWETSDAPECADRAVKQGVVLGRAQKGAVFNIFFKSL